MAHHLARSGAGIAEAEMEHHIVQTGLQDLQHLFAGDPAAPEGALINATKLALHQSIIIAQFLLLDQAKGVIGVFAARLGPMHSGAVVAALEVF